MHRVEENRNLIIGIDPGTKTGVAAWNCEAKKFSFIGTVKIHHALEVIKLKQDQIHLVRIEDPTRRGGSKKRAQGAGSIKRDFKIWTDYLDEMNMPYDVVRAGSTMTKTNNEKFKQITKYQGRTSEHARDAAMMVFGLNKKKINAAYRK